MNAYKSLISIAAIAVLSIPFVSQAAGDSAGMTGVMYHNGEIGAVDHNTTKSTKTREQVKQELDAAHKDGTHEMGGEVTTIKPKATGPGKTREQVKQELDAAHKGGTHDMGGESKRTR